MICRKCGQASATYHVSEKTMLGVNSEIHLCEACAAALGFTGTVGPGVGALLESLGAGPGDPEAMFLVTPVDCQMCGKGHASIHLFEASHGYQRERHLCEECGREAAGVLDSVFTDFPDAPAAGPRPTCPECGRTRFDFVKVGVQVRANIEHAILPVRILIRGCAWSAP